MKKSVFEEIAAKRKLPVSDVIAIYRSLKKRRVRKIEKVKER
jgi:hypothetical protein